MRFPTLCLLLCALHSIPGPASAQSGTMPAWVVPVLRLVSATHVEPTTGVVISADGLVLVPADFAAPGDEIVVLDGGTDIIRNGRPARLERGFPEFGLELLRVEGLQRAAAPVAPDTLADGSRLTLRAYPPAEQIVEGAAPVNAGAAVSRLPESDNPALAADSALPNVTGALLDACGNLAGLSLADGVQSLAPAPATGYLWAPALRTILAELQLPVSGRPCAGSSDAAESPTPAEEPALMAPLAETETPPEPEPPAVTAAEADQTPAEAPPEESPVEELPPFEKDDAMAEPLPAAPAPEEKPLLWPWLAGALLLLAGGVFVHRRRRGGEPQPSGPQDRAAVAPGPVRGESGGDSNEHATVTGPAVRLILRGELAGGQAFETSTEVSARAINVEIGRSGADLAIDSNAVSRRHARLNGSSEALTLTDLGSSNGSAINGVPCLEGEIMYVEPGDSVILGDARFTLAIESVTDS